MSARTFSSLTTFSSAAFASSASFIPAAASPQRVVIFISVVGCGTDSASGIRQNRRHARESATSRHSGSNPRREQYFRNIIRMNVFDRDRRAADDGVEERAERLEEPLVVEQRVDLGQVTGQVH